MSASISKSTSGFIAGFLTGALLASFGYALLLYRQHHASGAAPERQIVLKLAHGLDTAHPVHLAMVHMKERLEALSGGRVSLDIYPSEVLGPETQCIEQLQNGTLAMTKTSAAALEGFIPEMAVFGLPYLFRDAEQYWQVLKGNIGRELLRQGEARFLRGLCYYDAGSRNFYTTRTPVLVPDDLRGLKIRTQSSRTAMDMVSAMGGAPTPIAWGELYTALAQGTVEGAENNLPSFFLNKHYELCKHFTLDAHARVPDILLISTKIFDTLEPQVQAWILQAAEESSVFQRRLWLQEEARARAAVEKEGVTIHAVNADRFAAKSASMYEQLADPRIVELVRRIREVR